ncbi:hypothetical protein PIB30_064537 [Stylosanthes scabra]|uniref:Uncharacterized protein n=1 Tax=Stylosanthes scabra TaxID=79078 RepID=A0ABU6VLH8_9FABA|nr:hypothetical protein [Stylosanthes scabra]
MPSLKEEHHILDHESEAFVSPMSSEDCLNEYFAYEGNDCKYVKNESKRVRAKEVGFNLANCKWVASKLVKVLISRPDLTPEKAKQHMDEIYKVKIHEKMVTRALKSAREQVIGKEGEQYGKI